VPLFAAILRIPFSIIAPVILVICAIGAYTVHNSAFDVVLMLGFGIVGYVLKKCDYPLAPMVLAIVLGDKAEESFRQSLLGSGIFRHDSTTADDILRYLRANGGLCMGLIRVQSARPFWVDPRNIDDLYGVRYALLLQQRLMAVRPPLVRRPGRQGHSMRMNSGA
jgi:hypothetical protein